MDKATFTSGVSKVQVEGNDTVTHLCPTAHDGSETRIDGLDLDADVTVHRRRGLR